MTSLTRKRGDDDAGCTVLVGTLKAATVEARVNTAHVIIGKEDFIATVLFETRIPVFPRNLKVRNDIT